MAHVLATSSLRITRITTLCAMALVSSIALAEKRPRSDLPQQPPSAEVRRTVVGPGRPDPGITTQAPAFLRDLEQAERELFPTRALDGRSEFDLIVSGLPPPSRLSPPPPRTASTSQLALRMPDFRARLGEHVLTYLDFYRNDARGRRACEVWYRASGRYEALVRSILRQHGLPEDLMWVAVVESRFDPVARSPAGAAGLWQFMPQTAKAYGLVIDRWVDERLDPVRATHAAALFLKDLYARFGSWELALAAYNFGYGGVLAAIRKLNTNDFHELARYELALPWETVLYVPRIVSLAVAANNAKEFGLGDTVKDPDEAYEEVEAAPGIALPRTSLNPQYLAGRIPPYPATVKRGWRVRVPPGSPFDGGRRTQLRTHRVRQGETLEDVARDHGSFRRDVATLNALRPGEALSPGTILLLPRNAASPVSRPAALLVVLPRDASAPSGYRRVFYRVSDGEAVEGIAISLGVTVDELRTWNALDVGSRLHVGMTLVALVGEGVAVDASVLEEGDVAVVVAGTPEYFTGSGVRRERARDWLVVREGDTWASVAKRTGMTSAHLARVNHRSSRDPLQPGEKILAYVFADEPGRRAEPSPPFPGDLPPMGE